MPDQRKLKALRKLRSIMEDPDRVVLDAEHAYEDKNGKVCADHEEYSRACFVIHAANVEGAEGVTLMDDLRLEASLLGPKRPYSLISVLHDGRHLDVIDRVIEKEESNAN